MNPARHATMVLVLVNLFWGLSFALVKTWQNGAKETQPDALLASLTLIALRLLLALLLLVASRPKLLRDVTRRELAGGAVLGLVFFLAFIPQMWAMSQDSVTPALSAFLTSLACIWTPLLAWLLFGARITPAIVVALVLGMTGTTLLSWKPDEELRLNLGAGATVAASFLFAGQILLLSRLGRTMRGKCLSIGFFAAAGLAALGLAVARAATNDSGLAAWGEWVLSHHSQPEPLTILVLLVVVCTVLSFHWMNTYQPRVPVVRAAMIYLLEPVFAAAISIPWGLDNPSVPMLCGCLLILAGNVLAELRGRR
jgi:drug/metabolite transporter (DMT)-like permease